MIKLVGWTHLYSKWPFERALAGIRQAGFRYAAFGHVHEGRVVPDADDEREIERVSELLAQYELQPLMLTSMKFFHPEDPIERGMGQLRLAHRLGIPLVMSVGFWSYHRVPDVPYSEREFAETDRLHAGKLREWAREAERLGVVIVLKPHTGNTATARHLRELLAKVGSPALKACYDPGNVRFYEGISPEADFPAIAADCAAFIAKDHRGDRWNGEFPNVGEGDVDFAALFKELRAVHYGGPVVLERVDGAETPEQIDEQVRRSRETMERLLRQAGLETQ